GASSTNVITSSGDAVIVQGWTNIPPPGPLASGEAVAWFLQTNQNAMALGRTNGMPRSFPNGPRPLIPVFSRYAGGRPYFPPSSAHRWSHAFLFETARTNMVASQLTGNGRIEVKPEVLEAMRSVPREDFVPAAKLAEA